MVFSVFFAKHCFRGKNVLYGGTEKIGFVSGSLLVIEGPIGFWGIEFDNGRGELCMAAFWGCNVLLKIFW